LLIFATTWRTESEEKAGGKIEKIDPSEKNCCFPNIGNQEGVIDLLSVPC